MAASQGDGTVALIDLRTRRVIDALPARNGPQAEALAFFPDGRRLATGGIAGRVTLWDVHARKVLRTLRFPLPVWWVAVSPDGRRLAVQQRTAVNPRSRVEVRDVASNRVLYSRMITIGRGRGGLFFSPDGRRLAVPGCCRPGSPIEVWDARSGERELSVAVDGYAASLAFSPDGRLLAAGTNGGTVLLLDAQDGERLGPPIEVGKARDQPRLVLTGWRPSRGQLGRPDGCGMGPRIAQAARDEDESYAAARAGRTGCSPGGVAARTGPLGQEPCSRSVGAGASGSAQYSGSPWTG